MSVQGGEVCILYEYVMTVVMEPTATSSPQEYITMTEPYEGTTPITAPITTEFKGSSTETIVVETSVSVYGPG